jgi:hypothetical protein
MHLIKLSDVNHKSSTLTPALLQASHMLGLYHAELARILKMQCADVGELANAQQLLEINSLPWQQAEKFISIFECLYLKFQGDEALMCNWLRKRNTDLNGVPLYFMVDDGLIDNCLSCLNNKRETCE